MVEKKFIKGLIKIDYIIYENLFKDEFLTGLKSETEVVETSKDCKFVRY